MRIGVLGGGQLGRMLALAGAPLDHFFTFLDPGEAAPMAPVARQIRAPFDDPAALDALAAACDVITWEFENVSTGPLQRLAAAGVPVLPGPRSLEHKQDRLDEKRFFRSLDIPTPEFRDAGSAADLHRAIGELGLPVVLKTRRLGYDGKGQIHLEAGTTPPAIDAAWRTLGALPLLVERKIPFERELSILAVRDAQGDCRFWPLVENVHRGGILRVSRAPIPRDSAELETTADEMIRRILEATGHVGVLALELFQFDGKLLANEFAPRVHNSGHWTIDGARTSQFENHLRAITGEALGETESRGHAAMFNLIGEVPPREKLLAVPGGHLHLYGKSPAPNRKLGHLTLVADSAAELDARMRAIDFIR